jgi:hypothetical protein
VEGSFEHGNEPSGCLTFFKFLSSRTSGEFSRRAQLHELVTYLINEDINKECYALFLSELYNIMQFSVEEN